MTSAVVADPLRKKKLLHTFFVNVHLLRGADTGYLALQTSSAWRNYHLLMSRLFGSPNLVSLTELSSVDVKVITSFIKLYGWFSSGG